MQQEVRVIRRVHRQQRVQHDVGRIENARLALAENRISEAHPAVPHGQLVATEQLGVDDFLGQEIAIGIAADQAAAARERPPKQQREADRGELRPSVRGLS